MTRFVRAGLEARTLDGPEAEYAAAEACPGMMPVNMLAPTAAAGAEPETRAATPAPSTVGVTMHPTLPGVFLAPAADALRVEQPSVGAGTQAYPVLSTSLTAGARDQGVAGPETAGAIGVTTIDFKRVTGSYRLTLEDIQKLETLESTLTDNLGDVLMDAIDDFILHGVAAVSNVVSAVPGFFSAVNPL